MPDDVITPSPGRTLTARQVDGLARSGRITPEEADRIGKAGAPGEVEDAITDLRLRHAGARLDDLVAAGRIGRQDADGQLDRIRRGEHSAAVRAEVRALEGTAEGTEPPDSAARTVARS